MPDEEKRQMGQSSGVRGLRRRCNGVCLFPAGRVGRPKREPAKAQSTAGERMRQTTSKNRKTGKVIQSSPLKMRKRESFPIIVSVGMDCQAVRRES
jgi:hypothetical protein